ncbi:MAG: leucine-rich repeat domain-containing protein [Promethearchaeota archaeon]|nr:MAG: leucine-rich repeat domain-containing protein [Candidatus Lokiarchaeota archaeon]
MKEFKVNEHITLKLVNEKTFIYIKEKNFCLEKLGQEGVNIINNVLNSLDTKGKYIFLYKLIEFGYFYVRYDKKIVEEVLNLLDQQFLLNLVSYILTSFMIDWKKVNFDLDFLYRSYIFKTLLMLKDIKHPLAKDNFKEEVLKLIENRNALLYLHLHFEYFLEFLPKEDISSLFKNIDLNTLVNNFIEYTEIILEWADTDWVTSRLEGMGEIGLTLLLELIKEDYDYELKEIIAISISKLVKEHGDSSKRTLINFLIHAPYEKIKDLFDFEFITLLNKKDIIEIANTPEANLLDKLNKAIEEKYPGSYLEHILSKLGQIGADLIFKLAQKRDFLFYHITGALKELGEDMIDSFIRNVVINENNYEYGDWGYDLVKLFFNIFEEEKLKEILESHEYNIIERLLKTYNPSNKWGNRSIVNFFYNSYEALDYGYILKINSKLPMSIKEEILEIYQEYAYDFDYEWSYQYATPEKIRRANKAKEMINLLQGDFKKALNKILDEYNYLNYEIIEEFEKIGGEALEMLKLMLKEILYYINFELPDSFAIFIMHIVKLLDCETIVKYLDNQHALKELTYNEDYLNLKRLLIPILECYKKAPNTKAYQHAMSVIKKINNFLLVPLCYELDKYNELYYNEAIKVLSIISGVHEELIRNCFLKVVNYGEDLIYFFHKGKDYPDWNPELETLNGLLNKFYFHIEEIIDKKFDSKEEIDFSSSNLDSKFKQNFFEMLQYILIEEKVKELYSKDELKTLIYEYFNKLTNGKLEVFSYVMVGEKKYFVREGVLDISKDYRSHPRGGGIEDIDEIIGLDKIKNVTWLKLDGNSITEIKGLDNFTNLKRLSLSHNKISEIKGLNNLHNLERLNLSSNEITEIKGLNNLHNLEGLDLSSNDITEIKGLNNLRNLEWIYLSRNNIRELKGLENLENLKKIELDDYKIPELDFLNTSDAQELVNYCREMPKDGIWKEPLITKVRAPDAITVFFLEKCLLYLKKFRSDKRMLNFVSILINHLKEIKNHISRVKKIHPVKFLDFLCKELNFSNRSEFERFIQDIYNFGKKIYEKISAENLEKKCVIQFSKFWLKWIIKSSPYKVQGFPENDNNIIHEIHEPFFVPLGNTSFYYKKDRDSILLCISSY